jgi:acyl carrier protein
LPEPTPVQARLTELWTAQLQIEPIGLHDDFFELGGDSIGAAELQACIDREFGVEISATTLFLSPTVAALAEAIEEASKPTGEAR